MKLSDWARRNGVHPKTALGWFDRGTLPVSARKVGPLTILVEIAHPSTDPVALYARVSSRDQRADLERQMGQLVEWTAAQGLRVSHTVSEVGSRMDGGRPKLLRLLADATVGSIAVDHRDCLARLGSEYIEAVLSGAGRRLLVMESNELEDDLLRDMNEVLTSLRARLCTEREL